MLHRLLARNALVTSMAGSVRHARRRGPLQGDSVSDRSSRRIDGDDEDGDRHEMLKRPPSLTAGLRSSSFVSSSSASLDAVRREIDEMNAKAQRTNFERQVKLEAATATLSPAAAGSARSSPSGGNTTAISLSPQLLPTFDPLQPKVVDSLRCRDTLVQNRLMRDVTEVLRRRREEDILKLLKHALPEFANTIKQPAALNLTAKNAAEGRIGALASNSSAAVHSTQRLRDTLYKLRDLINDVRASSIEVLDDASILAVACDKLSDDELSELMRAGVLDPLSSFDSMTSVFEEVGRDGAISGSTDVAAVSKPQPSSDAADKNDADDFLLVDSVERVAQVVEALETSEKLFEALTGDMNGQPTEDLAPVLIKANRGIYAQVSEAELELLERHEEAGRDAVTDATASPNTLLRAMAKVDPKIEASLNVLDRARRTAVLDAPFQDSLAYVELRAKEKFNSLSGLKVKMRPKAAEVPFFFANALSKPPPAADMNLPTPKPSFEERRAARSERRSVYRKKVFFRR